VALLIEEQRGEIVAAWRHEVERELGGEPSLAFAVGPLLREMALALRGDAPPLLAARPAEPAAAGARSVVLVRSGASPGRLAREFRLLHRALWQALRQAGAVVGGEERRAADEWLDEALAVAVERVDRLRTRTDLVEGVPGGAPAVRPWSGAPAASGEPARRAPPVVPPRAPAPQPAAARPPVVPARAPSARPPPLPRFPRPPPLPVAAPQDVYALE
jgi:hypothetical protein